MSFSHVLPFSGSVSGGSIRCSLIDHTSPCPWLSLELVAIEALGWVGKIDIVTGREGIEDILPDILLRTTPAAWFAQVAQGEENTRVNLFYALLLVRAVGCT
ncbi:hypothetical protein ACFL0Q_06365, partial [Thermodesulfobacteriota bacterium]